MSLNRVDFEAVDSVFTNFEIAMRAGVGEVSLKSEMELVSLMKVERAAIGVEGELGKAEANNLEPRCH